VLTKTEISGGLAVLVAAAGLRQERAAELRALVARPEFSWSDVIGAAARHRMAGLVRARLAEADIASVETEPLVELARRDAALNLRLAIEAARLAERLSAMGVTPLLLKGPHQAQALYGDLALRQCRDLDLLIPEARIEAVVARLESEGYRRLPPLDATVSLELWLRASKDVGLISPDGLMIELHARPHQNAFLSRRLDLWRDARPLGRHGLQPSREALYAYLCLHGASSGWFRLKWLADLLRLLPEDPAGLEALHQRARRRGAGAASGQALLLLQSIFGVELPPRLATTLHHSPRARLLERLGRALVCSELPVEQRPALHRLLALSQLLLCPHPAFLLEEASRWLLDWRLVERLRLPRRWWRLYPLLRLPYLLLRAIAAVSRSQRKPASARA